MLASSCARFSQERTGADRPRLQQIILSAGIEIRAARGYQSDIDRLRRYSASTLRLLSDLSQISLEKTKIKIQRSSTSELRRVAAEGSVVVIGQPGAGKSGALHDFAEGLGREAVDYIFLAVDRLEVSSLPELRSALGLEHDLIEVLANWPGRNPAFLIIDALDAARTEPAARAIRDLIRQVTALDRWHVVASIRKFDLRYSGECKQLFKGTAATSFKDVEFLDVRHISIPVLTDEELAQVDPQSHDLHALIASLPKELREILFNLRLVAELFGAGMNQTQLTPIRTQLELLNLYWTYRVVRRDGLGDSREAVLHRICHEMVDARTLSANRLDIASRFQGDRSIDDLLSHGILAEWQPAHTTEPDRYVLTFSHHVLFDYAVSRLLLRIQANDLIEIFAADSELLIVVRPSLVFHFRHLWTADVKDPRHKRFWDLVFLMVKSESIPEIGKLIGPSVATELARCFTDLELLCEVIEGPEAPARLTAEKAMRHVVGSILMSAGSLSLVGADAGPWCELAERISARLSEPLAHMLKMLLPNLCEHPDLLTSCQKQAAGQAARRLLEFAWNSSSKDSWLVVFALQCVCRTFEADPAASRKLIKDALDSSHLRAAGYHEMPWLARETRRLLNVDPALVEDVYTAAFTYIESSIEKTDIGSGRILPLTSNRKQDYGMALYELAEQFSVFLGQVPDRAIRVLIAAIEAWVREKYSSSCDESESTFDFGELTARIKTDRSYIWDTFDTPYHDDALKMLRTFDTYMEGLATRNDATEQRQMAIHVLIRNNCLAVFWRRLLILGARFPNTLGKELFPLVVAIPVLICLDTSTPAGDYLKSTFPGLSPEERRRVEEVLISISESEGNRKFGEHLRNRLLGCLNYDDLVTAEARQLIAQLRSANSLPSNEPPVSFRVSSIPYGEKEHLANQGIPVDEEPNRKIRTLESTPKEFVQKHLNSVASKDEAIALLPGLQALSSALLVADSDGVHEKQRDYALGVLAEACSQIARVEDISPEEEIGDFAKNVLLDMSTHPNPMPDPQYDAQFDDHPSWGSGVPRIVAAEGLIVLARHVAFADDRVLRTIENLATDSVPAVRYQIARNLQALYYTSAEMMWRLVERISAEEPSRAVIQGFLSGPLWSLAGSHPDRVADLSIQILSRILDGPGASEVRRSALTILTDLYVWQGNEKGQTIVMRLAADPLSEADAVNQILHQIRKALTTGPVDTPNPDADSIRHRAFDLVSHLLTAACQRLDSIQNSFRDQSFDSWTEDERDSVRSLATIIRNIGSTLYYASGAFQQRETDGKDKQGEVPSEQAARFYADASPLLDELADVGLPDLAHHLLETLDFLVPCNPAEVFLHIGKVVRGGQKGGYQHESLAVKLMVRLIQRYLADHRVLFREDSRCRQTLMEVLDIFVNAGWPSARCLTYGLEDIFR